MRIFFDRHNFNALSIAWKRINSTLLAYTLLPILMMAVSLTAHAQPCKRYYYGSQYPVESSGLVACRDGIPNETQVHGGAQITALIFEESTSSCLYEGFVPEPTCVGACKWQYWRSIWTIDCTYRDFFRTNKAPACGKEGSGNPIYPLLGVKRELVETGLIVGREALRLTFDSSRNSPLVPDTHGHFFEDPPGFGRLWQSTLHRSLIATAGRSVLAFRGDSRVVSFQLNGSAVTADPDITDRLQVVSGGYLYIDAAARAVETYDASGMLTGLAYANGGTLTFAYSTSSTPASVAPGPGYLIQVVDAFGRTIKFQYSNIPGTDETLVSLLTDSAGATIAVGYDARANLSQIIWPNNTTRQFVYENATFPWALTGVVDERGLRYSTFGYDSRGRGVSTQHAGGVDAYAVNYEMAPEVWMTKEEGYEGAFWVINRYHSWMPPVNPTVTNPNGTTTALGTAYIFGYPRVSSRSQPSGSGCAASTSSSTYDGNGNELAVDDFNGNRICRSFDLSRNLETTRIEGLTNTVDCSAAMSGAARKVSTQWHPDWRFATKVAEPSRITTYVYNGQPDPFNGNAVASCAPAGATLPDGKPIAVLCKKVEQATMDATGALGFDAAFQAGVVDRVQTWTYNQYGQLLTAKGPRTDVDDTTTYTYYSDTTADHTLGDLASVKPPLVPATQYTKYNPYGQVLQMVDTNGVVTDYTYDLRQRLKTVSVAGQTTTYDYWPTGLLKQVTQPDASWVAYAYDDAHRLTGISDSLGNSITYTLDNAGNRTKEEVKDAGGALKRQLDRVIDALGRVQQATGRE